MALPRFLHPIPVRFLTDYARALQMNQLHGPLKAAAANLVQSVMTRSNIDETVSTAIDQHNAYENGERDFTAEDDDPVLGTMDRVIEGILSGQSLSGEMAKIKQYIFNQTERAELISNLLLTKDYQRLVRHVRVRDLLEKKLLTAALREDLNTSEIMAMIMLIGENTAKLETRVQAGATNVSDVMALLNKADYALHLHEDTVKEKFKHTTPTGREIVRRLVHRLQKVDKVSKK